MAHQTENIPWHDIASTVRPRLCNTKSVPHAIKGVQIAKIRNFVNKFEQTLKREAQLERQKYPESFTVPQDDETVITDEMVALILPAMKRGFCFRTLRPGDESIRHVPPETRKMYAFTAPWEGWDDDVEAPDVATGNEEGFFQAEIIKALLVHGHLEPILRIWSHPGVDLHSWHNASTDRSEALEDGWDTLYKYTLSSYLFYNVLLCVMDMWKRDMETIDWRDLGNFQDLWYNLSHGIGMTDICVQLHRTFLGMPEKIEISGFHLRGPYAGQSPFVDFVEACGHTPKIHVMSRETLRLVQSILTTKKVPPELQQQIIMMTGQEKGVESCLVVPYDPLHPNNRRLLLEYLQRCWKLLVHCEIISQGRRNVGTWDGPGMVDWKEEIEGVLAYYLGLRAQGEH